jgi:hypothetical protein
MGMFSRAQDKIGRVAAENRLIVFFRVRLMTTKITR